MKNLLVATVLSLVLIFSANPAFPITYEVDVGQDGVFETGESIDLQVGQSIYIDVYVNNYFCAPDDKLFGVQTYISVDETLTDITACVPDATGCDPTLSGCTLQNGQDIYLLVCSNFSFMDTVGGAKVLGQVTVDCVGQGSTDLVVADDQTAQGFPAQNDGFLSDCNLASDHPTDAVVQIDQLPPPCDCALTGPNPVGVMQYQR